MDNSFNTQPTQETTQPLKVANLERNAFHDEGVMCYLTPHSAVASQVVSTTAAINRDLVYSVISSNGSHHPTELRLPLYPGPKDPRVGYVFGRESKCDFMMPKTYNRVSNRHCRIYQTTSGALMVEDTSTNGTWVDGHLLKRTGNETKRVLCHSTFIKLADGGGDKEEIVFSVRLPRTPEPASRLHKTNFLPKATNRNAAAAARDPFAKQSDKNRRDDPQDSHCMDARRELVVWPGDEKYELSRAIGSGAFAEVYKAYERASGGAVAVKMIQRKSLNANDRIQREISVLEKLDHPNIVKYIEYMENSFKSYVFMEFVSHGNLDEYLSEHGTMDESLTKEATYQVLQGLEYIHGQNIAHRDLKPPNILIASFDPFLVKVTDFGMAKIVNNDETFLRTFCGTMLYLAPEVWIARMTSINNAAAEDLNGSLKRKRRSNDQPQQPAPPIRTAVANSGAEKPKTDKIPYSQAVDIWSLGCVVYCLLTGKPPFEGKDQDELCHLITRGSFDKARLKKVVGTNYEDCVNFIQGLLQVRPENRPTETEALQHRWLRSETDEAVEDSMEHESSQVEGVEYSTGEISKTAIGEVPDSDMDSEEPENSDEFEMRDSSGNECQNESLVNSDEYFNNGKVGISVIDRYREEGSAVSLEISKQSFGSKHEDNSPQFGSSFTHHKQHQASAEGEDHPASQSFKTPPSRPTTANPFASSLFDDDHNAHFNFCPDSLRNISQKSQQEPSQRSQQRASQKSQQEPDRSPTPVTPPHAFPPSARSGNINSQPYTPKPPSSSPPAIKARNMNSQPLFQQQQQKSPISGPAISAGNISFQQNQNQHQNQSQHSSQHTPRNSEYSTALVPASFGGFDGGITKSVLSTGGNPSPSHHHLSQNSSPETPRQREPSLAPLPDTGDSIPSTQSVMSQPPTTYWGRLVPLPGSLATEIIPLTDWLIRIGRKPSNTYQTPVTDTRISGDHLAIQISPRDPEKAAEYAEMDRERWKPEMDMIVSCEVRGTNGVYINGGKLRKGERKRLWDADEVILMKDYSKMHPEIWGYRLELWCGDVRR
ncbi:hypothetical protein BZA77DRAFT_304669 [Pyronema omphalodes]|nr:hypothetical protein BZA77DRAFT_304669 [Pyronema omphalodes]